MESIAVGKGMKLTDNQIVKDAIHDYAEIVCRDTYEGRVQAHGRLKIALWYATEIDCWEDFRPFESDDIAGVPTYRACCMILWREINKKIIG